ncbi:MAG TPA: 1-deoxy-D-xylulose-5-phosphate synthase [Acidimicrobiales bacterium]|nr:1-deoxy-D-xylulose-5-phosphate synthase [Acidimicrobiales bacterium]
MTEWSAALHVECSLWRENAARDRHDKVWESSMSEAELSLATYPQLAAIHDPADVKALDPKGCDELAEELRRFIVEAVSRTGGHLGSNLGAVEITIAMHRVFNSPNDVLLFDTGHQSYVHKILTGRAEGFVDLRKESGLSGYPSRAESAHDWIENSHASTALSYSHGIAAAFRATGADHDRRVVALVGDGALTGGMAYEALNNLGASDSRVVVVLNDNGRSYAPTVSKLSGSLTQLRLSPSYSSLRHRVGQLVSEIPGVGALAGQSLRTFTAALRELVEPHVFFEALGIRYTGPIDGHDVGAVEHALRNAATFNGPIVLHVLTRKGKGYAPAEQDEVQCLHDLKVPANPISPPGATDQGSVFIGARPPETSYTEAFSKSIVEAAKTRPNLVAITAAMPGPTGLLPFEARFPDRFFDVGIAEQHAMTAAAGMALAGLRPVLVVYSTFLSRAFDQQNLDVGLHRAPVVICADRAGITGDDGPSHHGLLDMVLALQVPGFAIFAPSEPSEISRMLDVALSLDGPSLIRYPKTAGPRDLGPVVVGMGSRVLRAGDSDVLLVGVGKMARYALDAAQILADAGVDATVVDPRLVRPLDPELVETALRARLVVTVEDGFVHGGAGNFLRSVVEDSATSAGALAPRFVTLGVPATYVSHGAPESILVRLGLDAQGIATSAIGAIRLLDDVAPLDPLAR